MRLHRPVALLHLQAGVGHRLARLSGLEGLARSLLVGTVPLVALERLESKSAVSQVYTVGAVLALCVTLNLGTLERMIQRRWVATLGIISLFLAALLFTLDAPAALIAAVGFRSAAASIFSVCLTLYVMDFIGKSELTVNESRRMIANGMAWLIGPTAGVWLWQNVDPAAPFLLSAFISVGVLAYFWRLRLGGSPVLAHPKQAPDNPLRNIARFVKQKHLRIAYGITLIRSMFWVAVFVYGPIYIVEAGLDETVAGVFLSGVAMLLFTSPLTRRLADRIGARQVIMIGFSIIGTMMIALGALGDSRPFGIVFWVGAACGGVMIDVLGNIPFMRMVKPRERTAMATVFSTWREMSEFFGPLLATLVLALAAPFWIFYVVLGILALTMATLTSLLPRRI